MNFRAALVLTAVGLAAACTSDKHPTAEGLGRENGDATFSLSGTIYGLSAGPDSNRVALAGVTVSVVRLGDVVPDTGTSNPDTGVTNPPDTIPTPPDSIVVPDSIGCPIEMLCGRGGRGGVMFTLDTVPTTPSSCFDSGDVITATTDASGSFTLAGLEDGRYGLKVQPATGSGYTGFTYCGGIQLREDRPDPLNFYLSAAP